MFSGVYWSGTFRPCVRPSVYPSVYKILVYFKALTEVLTNYHTMPHLDALTHDQTTYFRLFRTEFADDNFKFDENGRKLSKRAENTVGKGEIARYEQFLLFPQCFQKACFPGASKGVIVWEWAKDL